MEQVMYYSSLFHYIIEFIPINVLEVFGYVSKEHRDIVQEVYINKYICYMRSESRILNPRVRDILTNMVFPSEKSQLFIQSHIPSFISLREPIIPIFEGYFNQVYARDLLSNVNESIYDSVLLHMDQCMYHYTSSGINGHAADDEIITKMLTIARSYIRREDIRQIQDIKPYHRYIIMKARSFFRNKMDTIMAEIFSLPNEFELVIDYDARYIMCVGGETMRYKFGVGHHMRFISLVGKCLTDIRGYFLEDTSAVSIVIPNGVRYIDDRSIKYCKSLMYISLPNSLAYIGHDFLVSCKSITSIIIPNSVTEIGSYFLAFCTSLISITIPSSVLTIGGHFLYNCTSLKHIYVAADGVIQSKLRNSVCTHNQYLSTLDIFLICPNI